MFKTNNYWYDLSEEIGFGRNEVGVELTKNLYLMWDIERFSNFRDWVEFAKKELEEPVGFAAL
jgi:hypothetical protein